ncbi:flavin reductase [Streptosporangiaceae bacterium NEAU-GS5]|nr:flavin reductase [Streptosporangiaceae bacterium NEAU-GS5]
MTLDWARREAPQECPPQQAWDVVRRFATGVAVVTTGSGPTTHGTTVSSFAMVSRVPPMISVALRRDSAGLARLKEEEVFTVNMLAHEQWALAAHFAAASRAYGLARPAAAAWCHDVVSGPALRGAVGWLECRTELALPVGDHELVVARVRAAVAGDGSPLVQYGRARQ